MSDLPIMFSTPMILALLRGHKTQTRRILRRLPPLFETTPGRLCDVAVEPAAPGKRPTIRTGRVITTMKAPYAPGDNLWVRESIRAEEIADGTDGVRYRADNAWRPIESTVDAVDDWLALLGVRLTKQPADCQPGHLCGRWRPAMYAPRWTSRMSLTVTDVRIQRVQDITAEDACAEGAMWKAKGPKAVWSHDADGPWFPSAIASYRDLWDRLQTHHPHRWDANPWVIALTFTPTIKEPNAHG